MISSEESLFLDQQVIPLEKFLLSHPLGSLFTGVLYTPDNALLTSVELDGFAPGTITLTAAEVGRLFLAPDESIVSFSRLPEQPNGNPAGFNVSSDNGFVLDGAPVVVIAYQDSHGTGVRLDSIHLARIMFSPDAPARLCSVAIGLMACTAYRYGFRQLTLFAGGSGPLPLQPEADDLIGYFIWPKFGFDAPLIAADINMWPKLQGCASVLDVMARDSVLWEQHGRGREMSFDLAAGSRSWRVLINYLFNAFARVPS